MPLLTHQLLSSLRLTKTGATEGRNPNAYAALKLALGRRIFSLSLLLIGLLLSMVTATPSWGVPVQFNIPNPPEGLIEGFPTTTGHKLDVKLELGAFNAEFSIIDVIAMNLKTLKDALSGNTIDKLKLGQDAAQVLANFAETEAGAFTNTELLISMKHDDIKAVVLNVRGFFLAEWEKAALGNSEDFGKAKIEGTISIGSEEATNITFLPFEVEAPADADDTIKAVQFKGRARVSLKTPVSETTVPLTFTLNANEKNGATGWDVFSAVVVTSFDITAEIPTPAPLALVSSGIAALMGWRGALSVWRRRTRRSV